MRKIIIVFALLLSYLFSLSQNAGDVSPNAVTIKADNFSPFRKGSALIRRGTAFALINERGDFVVPFGTYRRIEFDQTEQAWELPSATGIYVALTSKPPYSIFINQLGKIIFVSAPGTNMQGAKTGIGYDGYGSTTLFPSRKQVSFNSKGDVIMFEDSSFPTWNEDIATYRDYKALKTGFKNSKGQIIINPQFADASVFSDGLVAVAKKNEFGEIKWGYADTKGKMVIPFKYSIKPGDFGNGLAFIFPAVVEDFKLAVINKKGEIVFKIPPDSPFGQAGKFENGYALCGSNTPSSLLSPSLDTTGKIFPTTDLFKLFNLPTTYLIQTRPFYNNEMYFAKGYDKKKGLLDFTTKKYIPAIFDELSMFDPVANLAYAKLFIRRDEVNNKDIYREGYINKEGLFVIIKGEPDKF